MNKQTLLVVGTALVAAVGLSGGAVALAGDDDGEGHVTGPDADRAVSAALAETGGRANAVERDGEDGATWEVEVRRTDGTVVDVRLDEHFQVMKVERDHENAGEP